MSDDLVRLIVVGNEFEAEVIRSLLSTEGIESIERYTDFGAGAVDGMPSGSGPREVLVHGSDLERARELVASQ
jgi:Putative prokaryotic signal transducing protein